MMKTYLRLRKERERISVLIAVLLTVSIHTGAFILISFSGIKYLYPPPEESSFVVDFSEEDPVPMTYGNEPTAEDIDLNKPVELIQKSESPYTAAKENLSPATKQDDFGDIDAPAPAQEEPRLDPRASFPGMARKDTSLTAAHSASQSSDKFKSGHPEGNTLRGVSDGKPNAHLKGRNHVGNLPRPAYDVQESGTVVVAVWVDQYGTVSKAQPGVEGTTVTDSKLWAAARKAAMETHFNPDPKAPTVQEGTITYIFNLK